jgi:hypothetical protein
MYDAGNLCKELLPPLSLSSYSLLLLLLSEKIADTSSWETNPSPFSKGDRFFLIRTCNTTLFLILVLFSQFPSHFLRRSSSNIQRQHAANHPPPPAL